LEKEKSASGASRRSIRLQLPDAGERFLFATRGFFERALTGQSGLPLGFKLPETFFRLPCTLLGFKDLTITHVHSAGNGQLALALGFRLFALALHPSHFDIKLALLRHLFLAPALVGVATGTNGPAQDSPGPCSDECTLTLTTALVADNRTQNGPGRSPDGSPLGGLRIVGGRLATGRAKKDSGTCE
jgi:hypothetical protein